MSPGTAFVDGPAALVVSLSLCGGPNHINAQLRSVTSLTSAPLLLHLARRSTAFGSAPALFWTFTERWLFGHHASRVFVNPESVSAEDGAATAHLSNVNFCERAGMPCAGVPADEQKVNVAESARLLGYPNAAGVHLGRAARGLRASRAAMPNTTAREARWGRAGLAAAVADCTTANGSPSSSSCQTSSGGFPSCRRLAGRRAGLECAQVDRPAPPGGGPPRRVACLGDSITAGVGAREASETYPVQLQAALGEDWAVSNFGAPGMRLQRPHNRSVHPRARVASVWRTPQWET
eukprot:gene10642-5083_t